MRVRVLFVVALSAGASASAAPRPPLKSRIAPKVQQAQQAGGELARKARSDAASARRLRVPLFIARSTTTATAR